MVGIIVLGTASKDGRVRACIVPSMDCELAGQCFCVLKPPTGYHEKLGYLWEDVHLTDWPTREQSMFMPHYPPVCLQLVS